MAPPPGINSFDAPTFQMDLTKIITVAGKSGLYRVVAQGRNAIIAEPLEGGPRQPVHPNQRVSTLEEISMFTTGDDVPLKDVLDKLYKAENGGASADAKGDEEALWKKLKEVLPEADRERIHSSDVRKLFTWYGQLLKAGVFTAKEEKAEGEEHHDAEAASKKTLEKGQLVKADIAAHKKSAAPKQSSTQKNRSTQLRKSSQRGS